MMNKENSRVYIDSSLRTTIKTDIGAISVKDFCEKAIESEAQEISTYTSSYRIMRTLMDYLSDVDGIDIDIPSSNIDPRLGNGKRNKEVRIKLSEETKSNVNDIEDDIGVTHSKANAMCILFYADNILNDNSPVSNRLNRKTDSIKVEMKKPMEKLGSTLYKYFSLYYREITSDKIDNNKQEFKDFSIIYMNEFKNTYAYSTIEQRYGKKALNKTEKAIDEHSINEI